MIYINRYRPIDAKTSFDEPVNPGIHQIIDGNQFQDGGHIENQNQSIILSLPRKLHIFSPQEGDLNNIVQELF
jgi:hypothetical protein